MFFHSIALVAFLSISWNEHYGPAPDNKYGGFSLVISVSSSIFVPLFGLLADVWIGRYKAILIGIVLCFLSWIIMGIGFIVYQCYSYNQILFSFYCVSGIFQVLGFSSFRANIVQYNIDQLVGASSHELSTIIYWHSTAFPITEVPFLFLQCYTDDINYLLLLTFMSSGLSVSLVLVSHSLLKHKLENKSLIKNPIKLIVRVLCYARKHKYPENRSALTYWEDKAPSRLDLGKGKYGGPFTEEEVEDVKIVFRILFPIILSVCAFALSDGTRRWTVISTSIACLIHTEVPSIIFSLLLTLVYLYLIRGCFGKYISSMLSRMGFGLIFAILVLVSKLIIFSPLFKNHRYVQYEMIAPQILYSLCFILVYPVSLEFTIAQSPVQMRGVMVGLWYALWALGFLMNIALKLPFHCQSQYICTSFYYYLTKSVLVLIILIVFVILAKQYKYRVRENEVNIVQIVDDHYQKYMEQEEQYNRNVINDFEVSYD